ncbi:MAG: hypothetical protein K2L28_07810 [Muribaculaceae bacterium]|nr:hypothetical protein [Muribaculaceae bacterium]
MVVFYAIYGVADMPFLDGLVLGCMCSFAGYGVAYVLYRGMCSVFAPLRIFFAEWGRRIYYAIGYVIFLALFLCMFSRIGEEIIFNTVAKSALLAVLLGVPVLVYVRVAVKTLFGSTPEEESSEPEILVQIEFNMENYKKEQEKSEI